MMIRTLLIAASLTTSPAFAASSGWLETEGAQLRLLARPTPAGGVEAALEIDLKDGWKTYWKVPGSSGVPPQIEFGSGPFGKPIASTISYPPPQVFSDGSGWAAGYTADVVLPVAMEGPAPDRLTARGMVGICAEICIPVPFSFDISLTGSALSNADEARVFLTGHSALNRAEMRQETLNENAFRTTLKEVGKTAFWVSDRSGTSPIPATSIDDDMAHFDDIPLEDETGLVVSGGNAIPVRLIR